MHFHAHFYFLFTSFLYGLNQLEKGLYSTIASFCKNLRVTSCSFYHPHKGNISPTDSQHLPFSVTLAAWAASVTLNGSQHSLV